VPHKGSTSVDRLPGSGALPRTRKPAATRWISHTARFADSPERSTARGARTWGFTAGYTYVLAVMSISGRSVSTHHPPVALSIAAVTDSGTRRGAQSLHSATSTGRGTGWQRARTRDGGCGRRYDHSLARGRSITRTAVSAGCRVTRPGPQTMRPRCDILQWAVVRLPRDAAQRSIDRGQVYRASIDRHDRAPAWRPRAQARTIRSGDFPVSVQTIGNCGRSAAVGIENGGRSVD